MTLSAVASNASVNLGGGSDTLTFGNFANIATVSNTQTITGGTGNDMITLGNALTTSMQVDLGARRQQTTLANVANTGTVSNVNTLLGGSRRRYHHARHTGHQCQRQPRWPARHADPGGWQQQPTVANVQTIVGGTGNDTITLGAVASNASIDSAPATIR